MYRNWTTDDIARGLRDLAAWFETLEDFPVDHPGQGLMISPVFVPNRKVGERILAEARGGREIVDKTQTPATVRDLGFGEERETAEIDTYRFPVVLSIRALDEVGKR